MPDIFQRLHRALPHVTTWINRLLEQHAASAARVDSLGFTRLSLYWPRDVLRGAHVVTVSAVPFPPVSAYGLPEFAAMENMQMAGITFREMYFIDQARASEALHFHELVHVVQWDALGPSDFLLTYGVGLAQFGYESSPLEAIAYDLQARFERGVGIADIKALIEHHAFRTREAAAAVLARHGIGMHA